MSRRALMTISEFSPGAQALTYALERGGIEVSHASLSEAHRARTADLHIERSLPPYDLPVVTWRQTWWNRPDHAWRAWAKAHIALTAQEHSLPHPRTTVFEAGPAAHDDPDAPRTDIALQAKRLLAELGGIAVVKPNRSMLGHGVTLVRDSSELISAMRLNRRGVVQEYLPEARVTLRVVVAGGRAIAAYTRTCATGGWKVTDNATFSTYPATESDPAIGLALQAMQALHLDMAGVDIMLTDNEPKLLEVNPAFGVTGLLRVHPAALDELVEHMLTRGQPCTCGETQPHDAAACA